MSLRDKIDKFRPVYLADLQVRYAYEQFVAQLERTGVASGTLKVGDKIPGFVLPDERSKLVSSAELLKQGPLVIAFFRGEWCPYCRMMLAALEEALPRIAEAGGQLVAMSPDTRGYLEAARSKLGLTYPVLSDVDGAVGLQFGVLFRTPPAFIALLEERNRALPPRHGNNAQFLPLPATFVVDRAGIVRYAFASADYTLRAEPDEIVDVLRGLMERRRS